jgi:hypothetical protein
MSSSWGRTGALDASASVETIYPLSKVVLDLLEEVSRNSGSSSDPPENFTRLYHPNQSLREAV